MSFLQIESADHVDARPHIRDAEPILRKGLRLVSALALDDGHLVGQVLEKHHFEVEGDGSDGFVPVGWLYNLAGYG